MKISILTPSFNSVKYIKRAIESLVVQDYPYWEHIIIDGGSTDGTLEILKAYPHLIWVSEPDQGQSDAMNKAFNRATGDIILYLMVDDEIEPRALARIIDCFAANPACDIVVGDLRVDYLGTISINRPSLRLWDILNYWPCRFPLNAVSYAYRRRLQTKIGPFPINNHYTMDYWFLIRAYLYGTLARIEAVLGTYHFDGNNKSSDAERAKKELRKIRNYFLVKNFYRPYIILFCFSLLYRSFRNELSLVLRGTRKWLG